MNRSLSKLISRDLGKKLVLLSGPRQVGKTTLARAIDSENQYLNYDLAEHREVLKEKSWDRKMPLVIFDEIHKMPQWKRWLKGIYDVEGLKPAILVTGSARLDISKKAGDSLAGRTFHHRLHPFDIKELVEIGYSKNTANLFDRLMEQGGFPEPFLSEENDFPARWRMGHLDLILRQDLIDLEKVSEIRAIEVLIDRLRRSVGSTVSYASLARDLQRDEKTIKRWIQILENLYVIFRVTPYHRNIARAILKEPKFYFYDLGQVLGGDGPRFENLVACALKKELDRIEDQKGKRTSLCFIKTKEKHEIDFACVIEEEVVSLIETKWADDSISPSLIRLSKGFKQVRPVQLVAKLKREKTFPDRSEMREAHRWLKDLSFD